MLGYEINYVDEITINNKTAIKEICVPFNFSKSAFVGLKYAAGFAKMIGADVTILNCFQSTALEFGSASDVEYSTSTYERKKEILKKIPELGAVNTSFLIEHCFMPEMLTWDEGGIVEDGVWAKHWYANVHNSTGFKPASSRATNLPTHYQDLCNDALPYYYELADLSLKID